MNTTISVRGGNLPPSFTVQLLWSPWRRTSGISKTAYTDRRGALVSELSVPASPPGAYVVTVTVNGVPYASALYTVRSAAVLSASASFAPGGDVVRVAGKRFVGNLKLELVAYPMFTGRKAVVLGIVTASPSGSFQRSFTTNQLRPGQWVLRAWSISDLAVQMAEAYFEVLI
ncbi:MAG: hypothetical protein JOZ41_21355 [Chloroflexi bacterium]|nr:hypothetical protein [Chloroflexota bacterium]